MAREQGRIFAQCLTDYVIQRAGADDKIGRVAGEAGVIQIHLHILLDAEQLRSQLPAAFRIFLLQQQTHGGNGGFDLMGPQQGVILPFAAFRVGIRHQPGVLPPQLVDERQKIRVLQMPGRGDDVGFVQQGAARHLHLPVAMDIAQEGDGPRSQQQCRIQSKGVQHGLQL